MAEIKGIDVSANQGNINWKAVANYGMGFAILRITEKGNVIDPTFDRNYKGCVDNKIPVGVYKYSYATSIEQIKTEANIVIKTLNKRKLNYPVFLDMENECQRNISKNVMMQMINAFRVIILKYFQANWCCPITIPMLSAFKPVLHIFIDFIILTLESKEDFSFFYIKKYFI